MADKKVTTKVRDLSKQAENMGFPKSSMPPLYLGTTGTDHKPAVTYTQLGESEGYPRGHTPEQMRAVEEAESNQGLNITSDASPDIPGDYKKGRKQQFENWKQTGETPRLHPEAEKARIKEAIARSKIDPKEFFEEPLDINVIGKFDSGPGTRGAYTETMWPQEKKIELASHFYDEPLPEPRTSEEAKINNTALTEGSLVHELGHYRDFSAHPRPDVSQDFVPGEMDLYGAQGNMGYLEGTADKFAQDNYVGDPRNAKSTRPKLNRHYAFQAYLRQHYPKRGNYPNQSSDLGAARRWGKGYAASGSKPMEQDEFRAYVDREYKTNKPFRAQWSPFRVRPLRVTKDAPRDDEFTHPETGEAITHDELVRHLYGEGMPKYY
jgi:hypothetical protein